MDIAVRLVEHQVWLVGQLEVWLAAVEGKESPESIVELRERQVEAGRRFVELTRRVVKEERAEDIFWEGTADHPDVLTYGGMIAHVLVVAARLRGLVISALWRAGIEHLRSGDPMLFLTDRIPR